MKTLTEMSIDEIKDEFNARFKAEVNKKILPISEIKAQKQMDIAANINHPISNFILETNNNDVLEAYHKMTSNKVVTINSQL